MVDNERTDKEKTSKVPVEKTYGEKVHDYIFNKLINFWATLAISGLFVFWLKHSQVPLPKKVLGIQMPEWFAGKMPNSVHTKMREMFANTGLARAFGEKNSGRVGEVMADALSINLPGTVTIMPSVWIAAKVKTPMVEALDRGHYGDNCENDSRIAERHRIIERERKPTVIGAVAARASTMVASTLTGWAVGAEKGKNLISFYGGKLNGKFGATLGEFKGIDHYAGVMGDAAGGFLAKESVTVDKAVNNTFRKWWKVGAEAKQLPGSYAALADGTYNNALRDWSKWTSLDIMYTMVTSSTIHPFMRLLQHVPFMSYRDTPRHRDQPQRETPAAPHVTVPVTIINVSDDKPRQRVSNARLEAPLQPAPRGHEAGVTG